MTKTLTATFVETLSDDVMHQMIADHELFKIQGITGDTELRTQTERFVDQYGLHDINIITWMDMLMFDIYRDFAMRYIKLTAGE